MIMVLMTLLMLLQVKLAHDQSSDLSAMSSSDTHDGHDVVDEDGGKPTRRSFSEAPAPPVSSSASVLIILLRHFVVSEWLPRLQGWI